MTPGTSGAAPPQLAIFAKEEALALGFCLAGICGPGPTAHGAHYSRWIAQGFHGTMRYLARPDAVARRLDLGATMDGVRSVLVVADDYFQDDPPGVPFDPSRGVLARYARGRDYHDEVKGRLQELLGRIRARAAELGWEGEIRGVPYVDTGPILERELAQRAGLGWFGKNTMLLNPRKGSYFFLGVLLLSVELPLDAPFTGEHCGTCNACVEACPTGALLGRDESGAPVMDARRCISFLTIELKGAIPEEFRGSMGNRIFGCDICQEVCPWNAKFARPTGPGPYQAGPETDGPALVDLVGMSEEDFSARFSGSPVKRAKRRGFLRNVAIALGNWMGSLEEPPEDAVAVLVAALSDPEPLVRGHAAWALGRAGTAEAFSALVERVGRESDPWVLKEISAALGS